MNTHQRLSCTLALTSALLFASSALAQQGEIAPEDIAAAALDKTAADKPDGWTTGLSVGASGSVTHSSNVVGSDDGSTTQLGVTINGNADLVAGQHEWQNEVKVAYTQTRTPTINQFVKSADTLDAKSTYLYRLANYRWLGPYARGKLATSLFPGYTVRPLDRDVVKLRSDGATEISRSAAPAETRIDLTSSFEPLVLLESAGVFANPYDSKTFALNAKLGAGLQQIFTSGGFRLADNADTPELELIALKESRNSAGVELELELKGQTSASVTWNAIANFFLPVLSSSADKDATGFDALNSDLGAGLSVKLAKWASLDYKLSAKRVPAITTDWQIVNGVMLTAGFNLLQADQPIL